MTSLRHKRLTAHGWGPLQNVSLDLDSIPGVVAVTGPNGSGKSTLLELVLGAMYRETPSRGGLAKIATVKGATLELLSENGAAIMARHVVDATLKSPRQESVLVVGEGEPTDGKVSSFKARAEAVYPPPETYLASAFAAQGGDGAFHSMSKDQRRLVLRRILGLERLQELAEAAREQKKIVMAEAKTRETLVDELPTGDVESMADLVDEVRNALREDAAGLERLQGEARDVDRRLAETRAEMKGLDEQRRSHEERAAHLRRMEREFQEATVAVDRAREAQASLADLDLQLHEVERITRERETVETELREKQARLEALVTEGKGVAAEIERIEKDISQLEAIMARADEIRAGQERVKVLEGDLTTAEEAQRTAEVEVEGLRARASEHAKAVRDLEGAHEELRRAELDSVRLATVPCRGEGEFAECRFLRDALAADKRRPGLRERLVEVAWGMHLDAPSLLSGAEARLRAARDRTTCLRSNLERARAAASDLPLLLDAEARLGELRPRLDEATTRRVDLRSRWGELDTETQEIRRRRLRLNADLAGAAPDGEQALRDHRAQAQAEARALFEREEKSASLLAEVEKARDSMGSPPDAVELQHRIVKLEMESDTLTKTIRLHQGRIELSNRTLATRESELKQAQQAEEKAEEHKAEASRLHAVGAEWSLLEWALGKDGVQALLIDAAGPAISHLTNELLEVTFGSRFRVSMETTKLDSTGKRLLETLDLKVIDSERGREGTIDTLSGGERVVVGLALRLALTLHQSTGASQLFLDECDGALDAENASHFVEMLRRGMDLGGLDQVVFVSHREVTQAAADHVITVQDGRVEVSR